MNTSSKAGWIVAGILAIALGGMSYVFLIKGQTAPYADGRVSVLLTSAERNAELASMRGILESVQGIIENAAAGDYKTASELASAQGMSAFNQEDPAVVGKLPAGFKSLGIGQRTAFDDLASFLETTDNAQDVMDEISTMMLNCVACHQAYRLGIEGEQNPIQE